MALDDFRPTARPTYPSSSMRSPFFTATASRPSATMVSSEYALQVPLERQGARSLTGGEETYPTADFGLRGALPLRYGALHPMTTRLRQARSPDPYQFLYSPPEDYLAYEGNSIASWDALPMHMRQRWLRGSRLGGAPAPFAPPASAPYDYLDVGHTQAEWAALTEHARARWVLGLRVGNDPAPEPSAPSDAAPAAPAAPDGGGAVPRVVRPIGAKTVAVVALALGLAAAGVIAARSRSTRTTR